MASKEAKSDVPAAEATVAAPTFAFELKLAKADIGEKTTNKQVKAKVSEAFMGYGAFDECRVTGDVGADRVVVVFFARLFGKGQPAWDALSKGEETTVSLYDKSITLAKSDAKASGGGATTGTSFRPKKETPKGEKKKGGRGAGRGDEKKGEEGKGEAGKKGDDDKKDGGRGRGRGKKEEVKGPSLQRGRANIGGKLGPVSKVRLAKQEREKKIKEAKDRADRGEKPLEDEKKKEDDEPIVAGKAPAGKKDAGKKGDAKKEGGKADAGKKDAGKKDGGKKEAGKAPAKAAAKK
jgi:vacuolar-type H+-ATPase subunit H